MPQGLVDDVLLTGSRCNIAQKASSLQRLHYTLKPKAAVISKHRNQDRPIVDPDGLFQECLNISTVAVCWKCENNKILARNES